MDETKEIDIDLRKIFYMMRTKLIFIVLATVLFAVAAGCFTHFFIAPTYSATIKMYAYSDADRVSTDSSITQTQLNTAQELVSTYIYILKSDTVLKLVASDLGLNTSPGALKSMIDANQVEGTIAFQVTVNSKDPELSAKIANSIAKIAPDEIARIVNAGGVEVIDLASVPQSPSSPNTRKNIMIGALAGFVLSFAGFFVYEMFDTTITNTKDLEREFDIPILGTIPKLEEIERSTSTNNNKSDFSNDILKPIGKPSDTLLENIQALKGDAKND
ncbi:MAG: YveK family protein [Eubacterium sp.]